MDYFNKRTNGMLMTVPLPQYIGNSRPYGNVGDMKNSGVEIDLRYLFQVSDVSFDIGGNATYISNRLIRLGNQNGWANYDTVLGNIGTITRAENGEPFPFFYGMRTAGIFQTVDEVADYVNSRGEMLQPDARPGDVRFVDCNGDGTIDDADRVKIGKGAPDWTLGFNLAVAWKGIDLGAFFNATIGNDIFDASYRSDYPYLNMPRHMLDRWTGPGSSNRIPPLPQCRRRQLAVVGPLRARRFLPSPAQSPTGLFVPCGVAPQGPYRAAAPLGRSRESLDPDFVRRLRSGNLLRRDLAGC